MCKFLYYWCTVQKFPDSHCQSYRVEISKCVWLLIPKKLYLRLIWSCFQYSFEPHSHACVWLGSPRWHLAGWWWQLVSEYRSSTFIKCLSSLCCVYLSGIFDPYLCFDCFAYGVYCFDFGSTEEAQLFQAILLSSISVRSVQTQHAGGSCCVSSYCLI